MATYTELKSATVEFTKINGVYISASDPTTSVNPSSTGVIWTNTTTGVQYINTDNSSGANTWKAISGDGTDVEPWSYGGTTYGYIAGGTNVAAGTPTDYFGYTGTIDKFSFSSDGNATAAASMANGRAFGGGSSSTTHGYHFGGRKSPHQVTLNQIEKFEFSSDGNGTDIADLYEAGENVTGHGSQTHGYRSGAYGAENIIDKWPFSSDTNATRVGNLTTGRRGIAGASSDGYGYAASGTKPGPGGGESNVIDRFPFASDTNASDVGDLAITKVGGGGHSSVAYGYVAGGAPGTYGGSQILKYSFASSSDGAQIGSLTHGVRNASSQSSKEYGYTQGGYYSTVIDKFSFASDGNATDVGDQTNNKEGRQGTHY